MKMNRVVKNTMTSMTSNILMAGIPFAINFKATKMTDNFFNKLSAEVYPKRFLGIFPRKPKGRRMK